MKKRKDLILMGCLLIGAALILGIEVAKKERNTNIPMSKEIDILKTSKKITHEKPKNQTQKIYSLLYDLTHRKLASEVNKKESLSFVQLRYVPLELQLCATLKDEPVVADGTWASSNTERFCRTLGADGGIYDPVSLEEAWVLLVNKLSSLGYVVKRERETVSVSWE